MAEPDAVTLSACSKIPPVASLTGDAQFIYTVTKVLPEGEEPAEGEEELEIKVTEDVRVAYLVKKIDASIAMIPVGAIEFYSKLGVPIANTTFGGLSKEASLSLGSWELLNGMPALQQLTGSLKSKHIPASSLTVLRSLVWPGFAAYCVPDTNVWGYAYVGDGMKNTDVAFCLP
jgi:radial spoke head protein 9